MTSWIDVKDALPEVSVEVLTYCKSHMDMAVPVGRNYHSVDAFGVWNDEEPSFRGERLGFCTVLYWMPIPKAPGDE